MATIKQQRAIAIYVEKRGKVSVSEAMRQAGYSDVTAKNPKNLTASMEWQEAMDHFLPDVDLLVRHRDLLDAKRIEKTDFPSYVSQELIRDIITEAGCEPRNMEKNPFTGTITVWYWAPDARARLAALDLAYKLKGKQKLKVEHSGEVPVALVEFVGDDEPTDSTDQVSI